MVKEQIKRTDTTTTTSDRTQSISILFCAFLYLRALPKAVPLVRDRSVSRNLEMLFFKRYLEKSQQVAEHFESSQIPCYIKMRELPAPPCVDHCRDLILASCPLRFMQYTEDWIVVEYFADHDSDYLVSVPLCQRSNHSTPSPFAACCC